MKRDGQSVVSWVNAAFLGITVVLLYLVMGKVDVVKDQTKRPELSGQVVRTNDVETERFVGEPLDEWANRHREACRRFRKEAEGDGE